MRFLRCLTASFAVLWLIFVFVRWISAAQRERIDAEFLFYGAILLVVGAAIIYGTTNSGGYDA